MSNTRHIETLLPSGGDTAIFPVVATFSYVEETPFDAGEFDVIVSPSTVEQRISTDAAEFDPIVTFSPTEASVFADSSVFALSAGFSGTDCYNIATPNYEVVDFKKWEIEEGLKRWGTDEVGKRWNVFEVIGAFDNECR